MLKKDRNSRSPPAIIPYAVNGEGYHDAAGAIRLLGATVSPSTLKRWIANGRTSFGLPLDVIKDSGRTLIPELIVRVIKEFLDCYPLPGRGASTEERAKFRQAAKLFGLNGPRSPGPRGRKPFGFRLGR